jgi:hypothetical protein
VPAAGEESISGADSQCALAMTMPRGLGSDCAHVPSSRIQPSSSSSGGAPWLM